MALENRLSSSGGRRDSRRGSSRGSDRAPPPAADRCPRTRPGSAWRTPRTTATAAARAVDRDLPLFHRLEQRRLRARRHPVDLVNEQQVGEHRPWCRTNWLVAMLKTLPPTMSAGIRSGVHCTRWNRSRRIRASVRTVSVLATPGTPSIRAWPPQTTVSSSRSSAVCCPTIDFRELAARVRASSRPGVRHPVSSCAANGLAAPPVWPAEARAGCSRGQ